MNEYDRDNLEFLLSIDGKTFKDWYAKMSPEDHEYAMELIEKYSKELKERSDALVVEALLIQSSDDLYPEANAVIQRIMQK